MYAKIKELADEAIALQNKDRMDAVLREISALCAPSVTNKAMVETLVAETGAQVVSYGEAKAFDSEAEMIESIQGAVSSVFPLPEDVLQARINAAQLGDTVHVTGISDGVDNKEMLDVKVVPAAPALRVRKQVTPLPAKAQKELDDVTKPAKKGGAK